MSLSAFWGSGGSPLPKVLADSSPHHKVQAELGETQSRRKQQGSPSPSRVCALRRSKGGRPPKAGGGKTLYVSLTGQQKLYLVTKMEGMMREGRSKNMAQKDLMRELGCSLSTVKIAWKAREETKAWAAEQHREPNARPGTSRRKGERTAVDLTGQSRGCRRAKSRGYLGRKQHCREFYEMTKVWNEAEREQGHELWGPDLLKYFMRQLKSAIAFSHEEAQRSELNPDCFTKLRAWERRVASVEKNESGRSNQKRWLMSFCGLRVRAKQRATCFTEREEQELVLKGWQCFDSLMHKAAAGTAKDLEMYVAQPDRWIAKRQSTVMSFSDQIPVWLKANPDKTLVHKDVQKQAWMAKKRRVSRRQVAQGQQQNCEAAENQPRNTARTAGKIPPTLVARQLVTDYFNEARPPQGCERCRWGSHNY